MVIRTLFFKSIKLYFLTFSFCLITTLARARYQKPSPPRAPISEAIRGVTIGPIENARHPNRGYGSDSCYLAMKETKLLGATWISITPFGRVWDLEPTGIDRTFEMPFEENQKQVLRAIEQAHSYGLKVLLVPHLWVESGQWRALIDPKTENGWRKWSASYEEFLTHWATIAQASGVEMLSIGVEMRTWATTPHRAVLLREMIQRVRSIYSGTLTYSANWDDAEDTLIWDDVDLIGINAFYPLAQHPNATFEEQQISAEAIASSLSNLVRQWNKPILFTEIGYTTRSDPALRPWEWPDSMTDVVVDQEAQATSYRALISAFISKPWFMGFFAWRYYADPHDVSQEAEWGFSPRGKLAELVLRDAFTAAWAIDTQKIGNPIGRHRAIHPGYFGWELTDESSIQ